MTLYRPVVFVLVLSFFASTAFADPIQGKITGKTTSSVNLAIYDDQGQPYPNLLPLKVSDPKLVTDLRVYDWVKAEIKQTKNGAWEASSIKRIVAPKVSASGAPFAPTPQPSGNLLNSLKTPQTQSALRGGLMGAVTGALSAGASGGKAGKGALVGAGVGAAAGLLQYLFNAPAPQTVPAEQPYEIQERPQHPSGTRIIRHYDKDGHLVSEEQLR